MTPGRITYQLRRLRLHGLIRRIDGTHSYQLTQDGIRVAFFFNRTYCRILRPGMTYIMPNAPHLDSTLQRRFDQLDAAIEEWCERPILAA